MVPNVGVPPVTPLTFQSTPELEGSFCTMAENCCVSAACTEAEVGLMETEIGCGTEVIVMIAEACLVLSAIDVATSVLVAGVGTAAGAVYVTVVAV